MFEENRQEHDHKRFKEVFYEYYPGIFRKLVSLVKDHALAEDLAQETFLRLYRNPPECPEAIGAWLHRVSANLAYDYLNRRKREAARLQQQFHHDQSRWEREEIRPEQILMHQWEQEEVNAWLNALPERDRQALMLRYSGYSYAEIAERLNVRPPLVGNLIRRALMKFKRQAVSQSTSSTYKEGSI